MSPGPYTPRDLEWHDHQVAAAAAAWLHEPRDTEAYRRMVNAVLRRQAFLQPTLTEPRTEDPEVLDQLHADRPPQRLSSALDDVLTLLRATSDTGPSAVHEQPSAAPESDQVEGSPAGN